MSDKQPLIIVENPQAYMAEWIARYDAERRRIAKRITQRRELYRKFKLDGF